MYEVSTKRANNNSIHGYVSSTSKTGMPAFGVDEGGFAATDCKGFL